MKKRKFKKGSALLALQKQAQDGGKCAKCERQTEYLTVDHIIPFALIHDWGLQEESYDHDWNFQLLCRACNRLKANKFDFTDPRTITNLDRYVQIIKEYYSL